MTLTWVETYSLWRGALLGLDIVKSKAESDSQVDSQPLTLHPQLALQADVPQRL